MFPIAVNSVKKYLFHAFIGLIYFSASIKSFAFRGLDGCDFADCGGYSFGFKELIFFLSITVFFTYKFFTSSEFRKIALIFISMLLAVVVTSFLYIKVDKTAGIASLLVSFGLIQYLIHR